MNIPSDSNHGTALQQLPAGIVQGWTPTFSLFIFAVRLENRTYLLEGKENKGKS